MNRTFAMILRNLRTELEDLDKKLKDKDLIIYNLDSQLKKKEEANSDPKS
jgi:hypothetical protein